jgi:hypothetical protein
MYQSKIAIIGAGFSGLAVMNALQQRGIAFDGFEADQQLGGNWYHGVYETVHIISSKKTTQFSEYPMPADYPDFPSAAQILDYLNSYADHFRLRPQIQFNTKVESIAPAANDCWTLRLSNGETRTYGGVVIANGHHWDCRRPSYPGEFNGQIIHSKDYKNPEILKGKRVLVIGGGNSACDIAVESARFGESAHISMRRGYWIVPKLMFGVPFFEISSKLDWLPLRLQRLVIQALLRIFVGRYESYGLQAPQSKLFDHHPTINSQLLYFLKHGRIVPHPDVARYDGKVVEFVDGSRAEFDLIVTATGFHLSLPLLPDGLVEWQNGIPQLIGGILPPQTKNLYIFGIQQVRYGIGPLVSASAAALCTLIETQRQLKQPIGLLLQKLGIETAKSNLVGPEEVLRGCKQVQRFVPQLVKLEKIGLGKWRLGQLGRVSSSG